MPNTVPAAVEAMPSISRRSLLTGIAILSIPKGAVCAERMIEKQAQAFAPIKSTTDEFLARASLAERIRYHSNALTEAMAEKRPDLLWRTQIDSEGEFVIIVARTPKETSR